MGIVRGNMSNSVNNNINNTGGGYTGYYRNYPGVIFEYNCGNNVDLSNLIVGDHVTAGQLAVDTTPSLQNTFATNSRTKARVKISFSANLNYTITLDEQMRLLFRLYRQDSNGMKTELTSVPYTISFTGNLGDETELLTAKLQKSETFYTEYFDEVSGGGTYTYIIEVGLIYSSIDVATMQRGFISTSGMIDIGCLR